MSMGLQPKLSSAHMFDGGILEEDSRSFQEK